MLNIAQVMVIAFVVAAMRCFSRVWSPLGTDSFVPSLLMTHTDKGFTVCAYNRTTSKVDDFMNNEAKGE